MTIKKHGMIWAALGFGVPLFWGILSFILFSAPNSWWTDMYWDLVYITCPSWLLPETAASWLLTPTLNACLYGIMAMAIVGGPRALRKGDRITR